MISEKLNILPFRQTLQLSTGYNYNVARISKVLFLAKASIREGALATAFG